MSINLISRTVIDRDPDVDGVEDRQFGDNLPIQYITRLTLNAAAKHIHRTHPVIGEALHAHNHLLRKPAEDTARGIDYGLMFGAAVVAATYATQKLHE